MRPATVDQDGGWTVDGELVPGVRRRMEHLVDELRWRIMLLSVEWFFEHCLFIPSPNDEGRCAFELYDYQRESLRDILANRRAVVLKARQLGWTTMMSGLALWQALHKGSTVLYVSKNQDSANKALGLVRFMWTFLPQWVKARGPKLISNQSTRLEWEWPDGSRSLILSLPATKTAGAGETADLVLVDEFALSEYQDDALRTLLPTISARQGRIIVFSTARGAHNRFARLFKEAYRGEGDFHAIFHPWMVSRIFDAEDYAAEEVRFAAEPWLLFSEYPSTVEEAFRESGRPRFRGLPPTAPKLPCAMQYVGRHNPTAGEGLQLAPVDLDTLTDTAKAELHLWGLPEMFSPRSDANYVLAVDPASGTGGDYTSGHVVRRDGRDVQIVAVWHANTIEPIRAARELAVLGHWFGGALIVLETTGGWGDSYINEMAEHLGYSNLYVHIVEGPRNTRASRYGYPMSWQKRPKVIDRLASLLRYDLPEELNQPVVKGLYDDLLEELGTFVIREDGKVAADVGCHDDRVMSLGVAVTVLTDNGEQVGTLAHVPGDGEDSRHRGNLRDLVERNETIYRRKLAAVDKDHRTLVRGLARRARKKARSR